MNSKGVLVIALKIGAVLILMNALGKFPLALGYYQTETGISFTAFLTMSIIPMIIAVLVASVMWFFPKFFIKNLFNTAQEESKDKIIIPELGHLLISLMGLYILTTSLADFIYHISFIHETKKQLGTLFEMLPQDYASYIATIAELFLGLSLIFGSKFITFAILKLQKEMKSNRNL